MKARGWHIQVYADMPVSQRSRIWSPGADAVVFDHFGGARPTLGLEQPGFADLLALVKSGNALCGFPAPTGLETRARLPDAAPLADALIAANADRIIGHGLAASEFVIRQARDRITPLYQIDAAACSISSRYGRRTPRDPQKILVDNPVRLYGF